jgi:hypothetical protein
LKAKRYECNIPIKPLLWKTFVAVQGENGDAAGLITGTVKWFWWVVNQRTFPVIGYNDGATTTVAHCFQKWLLLLKRLEFEMGKTQTRHFP